MSLTCTTTLPVILVVDDEDLVRTMAADMLEDAGFAVAEASTADAAWSILETDPTVCALFTDIEMPGSMNGLELASRVATRWPHIRLVLTSGRIGLRDEDVPDAGQFVSKPYFQDQLVSAVTRT